MVQNNLALLVPRRANEWHHAFVSQDIAIDVAISSASREANYFFPLYLQNNRGKKDLFHSDSTGKLTANINNSVSDNLYKVFKKEPTPEEIFCYIYAVLYSVTYRKKYAEFLMIDFPRVPFTKDYNLFKKMSEYGNRLLDLHLLKSSELDSPIAKFQGQGDNRVEKPRYDDKAEYVYINKTRYFEGITQDVWTYQIGGYQVCDKWLKDRKKRILSLDEIQTYCRIVTSIQKTKEIQKAIDLIFDRIELEMKC
jgi:predicted helicase